MLYIYGDSHAEFSFKNLQIPHENRREYSITMFRIGRDGIIINCDVNTVNNKNNIVLMVYGEIDCRCHIQRQIDLGFDEDTVINNLVTSYFKTIQANVSNVKHCIVTGIIPPVERNNYESLYGPITHEFPFVGTDTDRVRYTTKINALIKSQCDIYGYIYFYPYDYYTKENGCLNYELSDKIVHIGDNSYILEKFTLLLYDLNTNT